ncbi:hypothetical protein D3C85_1893790 [compost metagenome]
MLLNRIRGGLISPIIMSTRRRGQMSTCRKTKNTNAVCIDSPCLGMMSHGSNSPLRVL